MAAMSQRHQSFLLLPLIFHVVQSFTFSSLGNTPLRSLLRYPIHARSSVAGLESITVEPIERCAGEVILPGSKSLSNRALLLAALATGITDVKNLLDSDDIRYMIQALRTLNVDVEVVDETHGDYRISGICGPFTAEDPDETVELFLGNAGTAMRPLAAALCFGRGHYLLDGVERMRERPIADLVDGSSARAKLHVAIPAAHPFRLLQQNRLVVLHGFRSNFLPFLSALLMAAPLAKGEVVVEITDELVSAPYVHR